MKLKSLLSASLLLACLAGAAAARQGSVERREGDIFRGPVKGVRVERVRYERVGGQLVEGARRLVHADAYAPDGKRKEQESYAPDGAVASKRVFVYDDAGNEIEHSLYDGGGQLRARFVRRTAEGDMRVYNGDGSLRERRVVEKRPDGVVELRIYDGDGGLRERTETKAAGGVSVSRTYKPDGVLRQSTERGPGGEPGQRRSVEQTYNPDGTVYGRRVSEFTSDASSWEIRADNDSHSPGPKKTRETREFDARKNLSKITKYVWNEATNDYEPSEVMHYTVTYYR